MASCAKTNSTKMHISTLGSLLLPVLAQASEPFSAPHIPGYRAFTTIWPTPSPTSSTPIQSTILPTPLPCPQDSAKQTPPQSPNPYFLPKIIPGSLNEFIASLQSPLEDPDARPIELRQNGGAVGGGAPGAPALPPNQVSPITTIYIGSVQVIYTQLFSAVPSQGPGPMSGSIGMGTLTGAVGVVKTSEAKNAGSSIKLGAGRSTLLMYPLAIIMGWLLA